MKKKPHSTPEQARRHRLKRNYGLTPEDYAAMFKQQRGGCAICGQPPGHRRLAVDHNHDTEEVRGLLCPRCNTGLGLFGDNLDNLLAAIAYLQNDGYVM